MALSTTEIRILDTRIERVDPVTKSTQKIFDTIADNAGIVLGGRPLRPLDATSVAWLANKIAPHGLEPGQVVLAGSFIRPIETRKGDTIQADYGPMAR
jgi:2-oxo-hept-3-ene-1,7-dioate hydratase